MKRLKDFDKKVVSTILTDGRSTFEIVFEDSSRIHVEVLEDSGYLKVTTQKIITEEVYDASEDDE